MGFWSSIGSAISSGFSAVCSAVSSIGSALSSFATSVGSIILSSANTVATVIQSLGSAFGIIKPDEKIDDLGDRALQAAEQGIRPESFETYNAYMAEIRAFELKPEKSNQYSMETKQLAGSGITCKALEDKFELRQGMAGQMAAMVALNPSFFTAHRLEGWFQSETDINKIIDYFENKLGASDSFKIEQQLIATEKQQSDKSEWQIESELDQVKADLHQAIEKFTH